MKRGAASIKNAHGRFEDYRVNNSGIVNPSGNPYQFQIGLRYGF